jgi:hypothetical protein
MRILQSGLVAAAVALAGLQPVHVAAKDAAKIKIDAVRANDEMSVVYVDGTGFGPGAPSVTLDGQPLRLLTNDGATLVARLPEGTTRGAHRIVVTRPDGTSDRFSAVLPSAPPPPAVAEAKGPAIETADVSADRSVLTVTGKRFGKGAVTVTLDGGRVQMLGNDGTTVQARIPNGVSPGTHAVVLTRADGQSATGTLTVVP